MNLFLVIVGSFFVGFGTNWKIGLGVGCFIFIIMCGFSVITENQYNQIRTMKSQKD